jgi:hypothetical protein
MQPTMETERIAESSFAMGRLDAKEKDVVLGYLL